MTLHGWLHRRGIARILNSGADQAFVEARGPRWLARRLAVYAVTRSSIMTVDRDSVRTGRMLHSGTWSYRTTVRYRRLAR